MPEYTLGKRLKEAGWNYMSNGYWVDEHDFVKSEPVDGSFYIPTVHELMKYIGYEGLVLWEYEGKFYAAKRPDACRSEFYYDDYPGPECGKTPFEALVELYIVNKA